LSDVLQQRQSREQLAYPTRLARPEWVCGKLQQPIKQGAVPNRECLRERARHWKGGDYAILASR